MESVRMRLSIVAVLLISSSLFLSAQAPTSPQASPAAPQAPSTAAPSDKPAEVPANDAIVINGFCPGTQETGAACKTEIPKSDIDRLAEAVGAPDAQKRGLANNYARVFVESKLAEQRGIDKKPQTEQSIQEILKLVRMQKLAQLFEQDIRDQAANIPPADVDKYYAEHAGQYEQGTLQRIFIPKMPPNPQEKVDEATIKAEGEKIAAAAKQPNADFSKLQKQAYEDLKLTATPPPTELKDVRRDTLPASQAKVFDTNAGQVADPIDDNGGIYIYKVVSKKKPTQPEVDSEIRRTLEQQRAQAEMQKLLGNIKLDYNDAYFGTPERPAAPKSAAPQPQASPKSAAPASKTPPAAPKSSTAPKTPK